MLPRWHIVLGFLFSLILYFLIPGIGLVNAGVIFLASVFIDFDHYVSSCLNSGKILSLKESFRYYKKQEIEAVRNQARGIFKKGDFHLFHTIEFHLLILLTGFFVRFFLFVFIGMLFHSIVDVGWMIYRKGLYHREFWFVRWMKNKINF